MAKEISENFDEFLNNKESLLNIMGGLETKTTANNITSGVFAAASDTTGIEFGIDKTTDKSYLQSRNFVSGSAGWQILSDGTVEFSSGTFRGALSGNSISIGTNAWHVDTSGNMWWGSSATYAGATIKVSSAGSIDFTTGTFSGTLSAAAGTLGAITAGTLTGLTITGGTIQTASTGYRVKLNGSTSTLQFLNDDNIYASMSATAYAQGVAITIETAADGTGILLREGTASDITFYAETGTMTLNGAGNLAIDESITLTPIANPPTAIEGTIYADTDHHLYYYNGTSWLQLDN